MNDVLQSNRVIPFAVSLSGLGISLIIIGSVISHIQLIPDLRLYAESWQNRHDYILSQRDLGHSTIEVNRLPFRLEDIIKVVNLSQDPANRCAEQYYDVQLIDVQS
jgi:hypothetical protein